MREREVTEYLRAQLSKELEITPRHALDACASPDQTSVLNQDGLVLRIHSKLIRQATPPFHLVAIEKIKGDSSTVEFAFKIYDDLCENTTTLFPDGMLEALAQRFGLPVRVGSTQSHFIWSARIAIEHEQDIDLVSGQAPSGASILQILFFRIDKGPPMFADVAMAFCIRIDEYVAWLRRHKR